MNLKELNEKFNAFKFGEDAFHELMQKKIRNILLVSTFYDAYIFEQDGMLSEQLFGEYRQLNLSTAPRITSAPTGTQALEILKERRFDLVITMMRIGEITPFELSDEIKKIHPDLPVLLLLNVASDIALIDKDEKKMRHIDNVFCWHGDSKIFLSMIKYLEDKWNVENDTQVGHVRVVLLVEDSITYYSKFHPLLYSVILKQTQRLIGEELNEMNKRQRMRARPKVLLCHSYEEAVIIYERYRDYISAIISDTSFYCDGELDHKAGIKLIEYVRQSRIDCPIILQSSDAANANLANELGVYFLHKNSKHLLNNLSRFIIENLGYGDFIFRNDRGEEILRASSLEDFEEKLNIVPDESLLYHGRRNHFSSWLAAHGDFNFSRKLKDLSVEDFQTAQEIRKLLLDTFKESRYIHNRGKIIHFDPKYLDMDRSVISLSEGSLGGKGRGLAFLNYLLTSLDYAEKYENSIIRIPRTFIIGTSEFDDFIDRNNLDNLVSDQSDEEIQKMFLQFELSEPLMKVLREFLTKIDYPITVRSSGLLEDSQSQPFAGVYDTFMLPNNNTDIEVRLKQLMDSVKLVFASVFLSKARNYIESINYKIEEEKMAVIIQEIVGHKSKDDYFYPLFSGAAQSYNFYPGGDLEHNDGTTALALGLGQAVVDGEQVFRFCPQHPELAFAQSMGFVETSQNKFYAVNLNAADSEFMANNKSFVRKLKLTEKLKGNEFKELTSVWDYHNQGFLDDELAEGIRLITFRKLIKYHKYPLAEILKDLLEIGEVSFGVPVEIEFAVDSDRKKRKMIFNLLQIRPLSINRENVQVNLENADKQQQFLYTENGMGNGVIENIADIVFIEPARFDNRQTLQMVMEIEKINSSLRSENRKYILIGPGRWGTRDRFLGIPVRWAQINNAKIIVEYSLQKFAVEPSQGSHFFHNLVAMNAFYFTISDNSSDFIDWNWLRSQNPKTVGNFLQHAILSHPVTVKIDGITGRAAIFKS